jgi:hypothetical protein
MSSTKWGSSLLRVLYSQLPGLHLYGIIFNDALLMKYQHKGNCSVIEINCCGFGYLKEYVSLAALKFSFCDGNDGMHGQDAGSIAGVVR